VSVLKKKPYKKIALALSLCFLIVWGVLGTGASLAWFTDTSNELNNIFHFGDFELKVSHRTEDGNWEIVDSETKIFDENALYEPGYVQVVYLKVENLGDRPFTFHTAVNVNDCVIATNVFGQKFMLQDFLKFGVVSANTEAEMDNSVITRDKAELIANMPLHNYYETDTAVLDAKGTKYIALIVRMPEEVTNVANYRGEDIPKVELGITVKAEQLKN
jgi:predicted ribosomally synthesized peptide with SipW-like signal peptide